MMTNDLIGFVGLRPRGRGAGLTGQIGKCGWVLRRFVMPERISRRDRTAAIRQRRLALGLTQKGSRRAGRNFGARRMVLRACSRVQFCGVLGEGVEECRGRMGLQFE